MGRTQAGHMGEGEASRKNGRPRVDKVSDTV